MTPPPAEAAAVRAPVPALPGRRTPVRHPRRVSGPARSRPRARATGAPALAPPSPRIARRRADRTPGLALRAAGALDGLSQSALLDRLIRSRVWIGLIAFSLIGLVAMQLLALHLNTQVGRVLAREAALQRQNAQLSISASQDSAGGVVEPAAAAEGMTVAPSGSLHFVTVSPSDAAAAIVALRAPLQQAPAAGEAVSPAPTSAGEASTTPTSAGEASTTTPFAAGGASTTSAAASESPTAAGGSPTAPASTAARPASASATGESNGETGATSVPARGG
jgi:hypothetical protein